MRRKSFSIAAGLLTPAVLLLVVFASHAQELPLEKILNPVADYDPFEAAGATPPKFFPDEVDRRARALLIDALTQRNDGLADHVQFFKSQDAELNKQRGASTGLAEHAQDLSNNTLNDRERYIAAQKEAIKKASTPERKKYLEAIVNHDDAVQSERLMRQSSTNFWGGMFNRVLGSVDLVGVASGNYIGAAAETTIAQLYALLDRDMPIEERRALARDLDHLKRFPDDPRNAAIRKQVESLDKKKRAALTRKQMAKADEALAKGEAEKALFYVEMASFIEPKSKQFEETRRQAVKALRDLEDARKNALAAGAEPNAGAEQQADVERLLEALSLRDSNHLQRVAIDMEKKYQGKPLADDARDAEAVALEMKGWREAAKKVIEQIAQSSTDAETRKRAHALLQSPEYNLLAPFHAARSDRQLQSVKYVLLGEDFLRKNLLFAAGAMAAGGPAAATALGMVNAMMVTNNFYQVVTSNPVSAQPVIDAGVAYVRSHPNAENAADVYKVLAQAFEERGMFPKAIDYHQLAGSPKEKIDALKEKSARAYLHSASKSSESRHARILSDPGCGSESRQCDRRRSDTKTRRARQGRKPGHAHEQKVFARASGVVRPARPRPQGVALRRQPAKHGNRRPGRQPARRQRALGLLSNALGRAQPKLSRRQADRGSIFRHGAGEEPASRHVRRQPARQGQHRRHQESARPRSSKATASGARQTPRNAAKMRRSP